MGYERVMQSASGNPASTRKKIGAPELMASDPRDVLAILQKIPCDDTTFETRDEFVPVLAAIKGALGDAAEDFWGVVLDWALQYPGAEEDYVTKIWESFKDASVGWSFLEGWGQKHGCFESAQRDFDDAPQADGSPADPNAGIPETAIERAVREYVWCQKLERYAHLASGEMLTEKAFNAANVLIAPFGRTGIQSAEAEFQNHPNRRKAIIPTYRPGRGVLISETNEHGRPVDAVNLWRPSSLVPAKNITDDDVRPWLDHIELIFGALDDPAAKHVLDWQAFVLQHPGEKINHALVIVGETQGTGKDTAFGPFHRAIGIHNVATITPETLNTPWTHYLLAQVIRVEEMMSFKRKEVANKLKPMISTPPETVSVNTKNVKQYDIPNVQNWIMFTNHENAVSIEATDRRYWVHKCCLEAPREPSYYAKLYGWYDAGGCEKVASWLLQRDLSTFNPMATPPSSEAKRLMLMRSQPKQMQWAYEALVEGDFATRTIVLCEDIVRAANSFEADDAPVGVKPKHVAAAFKAAGFKQMPWRTRIDGKARQLWVRDPDGSLSRLSAEELRDRYLGEEGRKRATRRSSEPMREQGMERATHPSSSERAGEQGMERAG